MYWKWHLIAENTGVFSLALRSATITIRCRLTALKRINARQLRHILSHSTGLTWTIPAENGSSTCFPALPP
jgi:hypothetical protein